MPPDFAATYYMDLLLAWLVRGTLFLGIMVIIMILGGCSRSSSSPDGLAPPVIITGGDRASETRNYQPPIDGGSNEKSDCAPYRGPIERLQ